MKHVSIRSGVALLFILLFLYTGISKIAGYTEFSAEVQQSPILRALPASIAWLLPASELMIAFMLVIARYRKIGLYLSGGLMLVFAVYLLVLSQFDEYIPCSCGGIIDSLPRNIHIILNFFLACLAALGILVHDKPIGASNIG